jgi:hypothetical protein
MGGELPHLDNAVDDGNAQEAVACGRLAEVRRSQFYVVKAST